MAHFGSDDVSAFGTLTSYVCIMLVRNKEIETLFFGVTLCQYTSSCNGCYGSVTYFHNSVSGLGIQDPHAPIFQEVSETPESECSFLFSEPHLQKQVPTDKF